MVETEPRLASQSERDLDCSGLVQAADCGQGQQEGGGDNSTASREWR